MALKLGEKLQTLRKSLNYTQKDFAEFLDIPQPSLSAYENEKNSPTTEVLINIAQKCNISLDWLCGLTNTENKQCNIHELGDLAAVIYALMEINEIGIEIKVNDRVDIETEDNRWSTQLTIYGNDTRYLSNADLCQIIARVKELNLDVESFEIDAETYEMKKERDLACYQSHPLTKRVIPELTREERIKKRNEWLRINITKS